MILTYRDAEQAEDYSRLNSGALRGFRVADTSKILDEDLLTVEQYDPRCCNRNQYACRPVRDFVSSCLDYQPLGDGGEVHDSNPFDLNREMG